VISTLAGDGNYGYSGDGGPATAAKLSFPTGIAVNQHGDIVFSDTSNNRIRLISSSSGIISTVAGNGEQGYFQINTAADSTANPGGERSWFGLLEAYAGNEGLRELGTPLAALASGTEKITDRASLLLFYRDSLHAAISAWREESITDPQARLLDAFVSRGMLSNNLATLPAPLKSLVETYRKLEHEIRKPARAPGVMEGEPWDKVVHEAKVLIDFIQSNHRNNKKVRLVIIFFND
jgi:hypothetical protein